MCIVEIQIYWFCIFDEDTFTSAPTCFTYSNTHVLKFTGTLRISPTANSYIHFVGVYCYITLLYIYEADLNFEVYLKFRQYVYDYCRCRRCHYRVGVFYRGTLLNNNGNQIIIIRGFQPLPIFNCINFWKRSLKILFYFLYMIKTRNKYLKNIYIYS